MGDSGVRNPLEPTPARLEWLKAIARGEVEATRVDVDNVGGQRWLPCGEGRMPDWLTDPLVYPMWTASVHIAPAGQCHRVKLTPEGRQLLENWSNIAQPKKGSK